MKPIKLALKGFAGIASGMGKSEVTLDLDTLVPAQAQIVALSGHNGAGKTTIMDNLHPYRVMPSRATNPTPGGFSYYEEIVGGEGSKELVWEFMGVRYQSILRFRATAKTQKTEAYLFVINPDGSSQPWKDPRTGAESDGKASTYDKAIESILGKPEVFFQAQFSYQNRAPIGTMTAGDVKRLIADMIGTSKSAELAAKASDVLKALKPRQSMAQDALDRLRDQMPQREQLQAELDKHQADLACAGDELKSLHQQVAQVTAKIAGAEGSAQQRKVIEQQHKAWRQEVDEFAAESQSMMEKLACEKANELSTITEQEQSAQRSIAASEAMLQAAQREVGRLESVLASEKEINSAKQLVLDIHRQLQEQQKIVDDAIPQVMLLEKVQAQIEEIAGKLATTKSDGVHMAQALAQAKETAGLLTQVPCQGTDISGQCKLLSNANDAAGKIPQTETKVLGLRQGYVHLKGESEALAAKLVELRQAKSCHDAAVADISSLKLRLQRAQSVIETEAKLDEARAQLPQSKAHLQEAVNRLADTKAEHAAVVQKRSSFQASFAQKEEALNATLAQKKQRLDALGKSLPPLQVGDDVATLMQQQAQLQEKVKGCEAQMVRLQEAIASVKAKFEVLQQQQVEQAKIEKTIQAYAREISHWVLLTKALGTDGIIAMTIDDAGPEISRKANELLEDCYGGRFALSLLTQKETQAGIAKETFLIQVEDNHRGENKLLDKMSGGEKVWINECLVRGISLYMAEVADVRSQTLFSDESDGPLDPQRKRQYMSMKRAVLQRGGYEREYVITQTPELLAMCDAVIDVTKL